VRRFAAHDDGKAWNPQEMGEAPGWEFESPEQERRLRR